MSNDAQKVHYARSINEFAEKKVTDALNQLGKALPCHVIAVAGSIVTVRFDIATDTFTIPDVTCPMFGPEYIRYPTQVGDKGVVMSADVYIGGVSGLGAGVASLTPVTNLSSLIFFPIANKNWSETENPNAVVIYGPDGAIIRTLEKTTTLTVNTDDGLIIITDKKVQVTATEDITLHTDAALALEASSESTFEADGETLTVGGGSIRSSGVLKAGNGVTHSATISGHLITVEDGIVTAFT